MKKEEIRFYIALLLLGLFGYWMAGKTGVLAMFLGIATREWFDSRKQ